MIRCTPRGICSWNFDLHGDGHAAEILIRVMKERGGIVIDGLHYEIVKHGAFSGLWTLEREGEKLYTAKKATALTRSFEIKGPGHIAQLSAQSVFKRTMQLHGEGTNCTITPDHAFTRRATIEGTFTDFRLVAFAFWLTVLTWRRAASSSSSNSSGGGV